MIPGHAVRMEGDPVFLFDHVPELRDGFRFCGRASVDEVAQIPERVDACLFHELPCAVHGFLVEIHFVLRIMMDVRIDQERQCSMTGSRLFRHTGNFHIG